MNFLKLLTTIISNSIEILAETFKIFTSFKKKAVRLQPKNCFKKLCNTTLEIKSAL